MLGAQQTDSPYVVTIADAARRLAVSPATILRLIDRGELTKIKVGRATRITARSIDALTERGGAPRVR